MTDAGKDAADQYYLVPANMSKAKTAVVCLPDMSKAKAAMSVRAWSVCPVVCPILSARHTVEVASLFQNCSRIIIRLSYSNIGSYLILQYILILYQAKVGG